MLDSYHDRRTGYEFVVNPAGVKADYAIYNDGNEDVAWDAVWDVATRIDSLGWTAEYRIPLSQLRYSAKGRRHLRLPGLARPIQRHTETRHLAALPPLAVRLHLAVRRAHRARGPGEPGPRGDHPLRRSTKNVPGPASADYARDQDVTVGGDLKYRIASNLLLNATVNPDFGQVEADPSVLNLSAFETFFERAAALLRGGQGALHLHRELRRGGGLQHRRGAVLLPAHRPDAAARRRVR